MEEGRGREGEPFDGIHKHLFKSDGRGVRGGELLADVGHKSLSGFGIDVLFLNA